MRTYHDIHLSDRRVTERPLEGEAIVKAGRYLIAVIRDRGLKSPELTGEWEARLREIERGQLDPGRFMAEYSTPMAVSRRGSSRLSERRFSK